MRIFTLINVRSGWLNFNNSALRVFGYVEYVWSRSAAAYSSPTSATAYVLYFGPAGVNPSDGPRNRWNGFPVRCLVILVRP